MVPISLEHEDVQADASSPFCFEGNLEITLLNRDLWEPMNCFCKMRAFPVANSGDRQHRKGHFKDSRCACVSGLRLLRLAMLTSSAKGISSTSSPSVCSGGHQFGSESRRGGMWQPHPSDHAPTISDSWARRQIMAIVDQSKSEAMIWLILCKWALEPSSATRKGLLLSSGEPLKYTPQSQDCRSRLSIGKTWAGAGYYWLSIVIGSLITGYICLSLRWWWRFPFSTICQT